jgi:hypothetical protein
LCAGLLQLPLAATPQGRARILLELGLPLIEQRLGHIFDPLDALVYLGGSRLTLLVLGLELIVLLLECAAFKSGDRDKFFQGVLELFCRLLLAISRRLDPVDEDIALGKAKTFHHVVIG